MSTVYTSATSANKMNSLLPPTSTPKKRIPSPLTITDSNGNFVTGKGNSVNKPSDPVKHVTVPLSTLSLSKLKRSFETLCALIRDAKQNYDEICAVFTRNTKLLGNLTDVYTIAIINKMVIDSKAACNNLFFKVKKYEITIINPIYVVLKATESKTDNLISIEKMKEYENDIKTLLLLVPQIVNTFNDTVYEIMYPNVISSLTL